MQASLGKHQHHHHDPYDHYHLHHRRHDPYEARKRYDSFHCRYSLASADVDADGLADLFVGAPFYHKVSQLLITMVMIIMIRLISSPGAFFYHVITKMFLMVTMHDDQDNVTTNNTKVRLEPKSFFPPERCWWRCLLLSQFSVRVYNTSIHILSFHNQFHSKW